MPSVAGEALREVDARGAVLAQIGAPFDREPVDGARARHRVARGSGHEEDADLPALLGRDVPVGGELVVHGEPAEAVPGVEPERERVVVVDLAHRADRRDREAVFTSAELDRDPELAHQVQERALPRAASPMTTRRPSFSWPSSMCSSTQP